MQNVVDRVESLIKTLSQIFDLSLKSFYLATKHHSTFSSASNSLFS